MGMSIGGLIGVALPVGFGYAGGSLLGMALFSVQLMGRVESLCGGGRYGELSQI